jgi:exosortase
VRTSIGKPALLELGVLAILALHFHRALLWIGRSWSDSTYDSWGFLALIVVLPWIWRSLPERREHPSLPHLAGVLVLCLVDLLLTPLAINIVSASCALLGLHLFAVAFRRYRGSWIVQPQLYLALLCLPLVHWGNLLVGHVLQRFATRAAAAGLGLYGYNVAVDGTLLQIDGVTFAVDSACSGLRVIFSAGLFALLIAPREVSVLRRALFFTSVPCLALLANITRVMCLALLRIRSGEAAGELLHQGLGLVLFVLCCAALLGIRRSLKRPALQPLVLNEAGRC